MMTLAQLAALAPELAAWNQRQRMARAAYYSPPEIDAPKTSRFVGLGVGICERCGIDSVKLQRQKCPPCRTYLYRLAHPERRLATQKRYRDKKRAS